MNIPTLLKWATAFSLAPIAAYAGDLAFRPVEAPTEDAGKRKIVVSGEALLDGQAIPIAFQTLFRSGDMLGDSIFGQLHDQKGKPLMAGGYPASNAADFTSLLPVDDKLYSITHFENLPGAMYLSEFKQDAAGNLTPVSTRSIDFSPVGGLWNPCAGIVTAWGTHLGSEEYPQDARKMETATAVSDFEKDEVTEMARYAGLDPATMSIEDYRAAVDPYNYGYGVEVRVRADGEPSVTKHYSMGRVAFELANVMPDRRTAYISDDGSNTGLFRYVADREGDLSAGQLFAAKWVQVSADNGGEARLEWIDLGHGDDASVAAAIKAGTRFSDLFETAGIGDDGSCPEGFLSSNAEGRAECLKVKPGMDMLASRLETRRYASMQGATTEFRKMEGSTFDPATRTFYLAMSEISKGMTDADEKADKGGRNDIRLAKNTCGAVYALPLDENYVATGMKAAVIGVPTAYGADSPYAKQTCAIDGIANPDNITFIGGYQTLIIAEDTGEGHQNDAIWAFNTEKRTLMRIATTPYGAEATSVDWYPDVNGHAYLMAVVQHPYGESDEDKLTDKADARAYVGYIGPFPAVK